MSKWVRMLDIVKEWDASNADESLVYKTAEAIVVGLKNFKIEGDYVLDGIIEEFALVAADHSATYSEFNYPMNDLYDWADTSLDGLWNGRKNCWIKTFE